MLRRLAALRRARLFWFERVALAMLLLTVATLFARGLSVDSYSFLYIGRVVGKRMPTLSVSRRPSSRSSWCAGRLSRRQNLLLACALL